MPKGAYHLKILVRDGRRSKAFYHALFKQLHWKVVYEDADAAGYTDGRFTLWVIPVETKSKKHHTGDIGFHHFAMRVSSPKKVDALYKWLHGRKIQVVDAPARYPQYNPKYYSVFFLDPDGLKLEVVYR